MQLRFFPVVGALFVVPLIASAAVQDETPADTETEGASEPRKTSADAEALRSKIHDMRMNLLLGGDQVKRAESEAIGFYGQKADLIDQRLDTIGADLTEKRASYELVLDRALNSSDAKERTEAMADASQLRSEISMLEMEDGDLRERRTGLSKLITSVESREKERERLVAQIETNQDFSDPLGMPMSSIGLAPPVQPAEASSPFENNALIQDLLERDPIGARALLFDQDPVGYWVAFPLQPPRDVLRDALAFPLPDLPGER